MTDATRDAGAGTPKSLFPWQKHNNCSMALIRRFSRLRVPRIL